jgi:drug/metabolite transporter (DMT)-like permease
MRLMHPKFRPAAWFVLAATLLLWSGNWIVARAVRDDIAPGIATMGRLFVVILILLPFCFSGLRRKIPGTTAEQWQTLFFLGLFGGGLHLALQWLGLHYTTATSGILYLSTSPLFILLMARPLLGEPIGWKQWAGIAVSFCGVALIATQGGVMGFSFNRGDLMALASMAMWAGYTVFLRLRKDNLNTIELIVVVCAFGVVFMTPWVWYEVYQRASFGLTRVGALAVLYSAIGSLLLAYAGWSYVVTRLGAARAGATMHLMPAIGAVLAMVFLDELPRWFHFAGIGLILAGVGLSTWRRLRSSSAASSR